MTPDIDHLLTEQRHFRVDNTSIILKIKDFIGKMKVVTTLEPYLYCPLCLAEANETQPLMSKKGDRFISLLATSW